MDNEQGFKDALACWASGVSVVTCREVEGPDAGKAYGLTVSSFSSLSLHPPLVLVCLNNRNRMPEMAQRVGRFAVSILASGQDDASNHFARPGRDPVVELPVPCSPCPNGQPVIDGSAAWLSCSVHQAVQQGDHTILIGAVDAVHSDSSAKPLVYYRRAYRTVTGLDAGP